MIAQIILIGMVSVIAFCATYSLSATCFPETTNYDWHKINIVSFWSAVAGLLFIFFGRYSQTKFARIEGATSPTEVLITGISNLVSVTAAIGIVLIVVGLGLLFIAGVIGEMLGLGDDGINAIAVILALLFCWWSISNLYDYFTSAPHNPDAHLHLLILFSFVPPVILSISIFILDLLTPLESEIEPVAAVLSIFTYPFYYFGFIANSSLQGIVSVPIFNSQELFVTGLATGVLGGVLVSARQPLFFALLYTLTITKIVLSLLMTYSVNTFKFVILLRPFDTS